MKTMSSIHFLALALCLHACGDEVISTRGGTDTPDTSSQASDSSPTPDAGPSDISMSDASEDGTSRPLVTVTVSVQAPVETPASSIIEVSATSSAGTVGVRATPGAQAINVSLSLPLGLEHTISVTLVEPRSLLALDATGDVLTAKLTPDGPASVSLAIDHWGASARVSTIVLLAAVPANTPSADKVFVSGNHSALGDWNATGLETWTTLDGRRAAYVDVPSGTNLEFKFNRGSWETVEKDASGGELDNRKATASSMFQRLEMTVAAWADLIPEPAGPARIEDIGSVPSDFLGPEREVHVYLPPGYDATDALYPVLYMHDGQNLMDADSSAFGVEWGVDETASWLINEGTVEPLIIVGIDSTPDRMDEYTPVVDLEYGGGGADDYGRFLVEELKPLIDSKYRTRKDAASTGLAGSSLGGLVSMYLGAEYDDVFGRIGVISPSVWWADRYIVEYVEGLDGKLPLNIWLDIGTEEGSGETVADTQMLRDALVAKGWVLETDLAYREYEGAEHDEASWAARFNDILAWLYPAR